MKNGRRIMGFGFLCALVLAMLGFLAWRTDAEPRTRGELDAPVGVEFGVDRIAPPNAGNGLSIADCDDEDDDSPGPFDGATSKDKDKNKDKKSEQVLPIADCDDDDNDSHGPSDGNTSGSKGKKSEKVAITMSSGRSGTVARERPTL